LNCVSPGSILRVICKMARNKITDHDS